jgi:hypothetical protein
VRVWIADPLEANAQNMYVKHGIKLVIPYPLNQEPMEEEFLRVDRLFKFTGLEA